jgi:uncharacterized protein (TIGR00369 family)
LNVDETLVPDDVRILTIEFKINFLKPAYGNALKCKSEVINQGKNIIVAQSSVFDVRDNLLSFLIVDLAQGILLKYNLF